MPERDVLKANISSAFTCIEDAPSGDNTKTCHDPPRLLFTKVYAQGYARVQGHGVAVVGSSAYFFGGEYPGGELSDEFWQLDGAQYLPTRVDLTYVSRVSPHMYVG
jgi:hypothetical protein